MFYVLSNVFGCVDNKASPTRAIFICQFLFARGDEENWLFFYVANISAEKLAC